MSSGLAALRGKTTTVTLKIGAAGTYVGGRWQPNTTPIEVPDYELSVQQASPDEQLLLPEGKRGRETLRLYDSNVNGLMPADDEAGTDGDIVVHEGREFEVQRVDRYKMGLLNHARAFAVRVNP